MAVELPVLPLAAVALVTLACLLAGLARRSSPLLVLAGLLFSVTAGFLVTAAALG